VDAAGEERERVGDAGPDRAAAADGLGSTAVAAKVGVEVGTARKWRARFLAQRLEGLLDEPRPGRPRTVTD
jgi:transposase